VLGRDKITPAAVLERDGGVPVSLTVFDIEREDGAIVTIRLEGETLMAILLERTILRDEPRGHR